MRLRELDVGAAWNESERRAIAIGVGGFFVGGIANVFGVSYGIREPLLSAICGAIGTFLGSLCTLVGSYHRRLTLGIASCIVFIALPWVIAAVGSALSGRPNVALGLSVCTGAVLYSVLHYVHTKLSGVGVARYVEQLSSDERGNPKVGWERVVLWVVSAIGAATIIMILRN